MPTSVVLPREFLRRGEKVPPPSKPSLVVRETPAQDEGVTSKQPSTAGGESWLSKQQALLQATQLQVDPDVPRCSLVINAMERHLPQRFQSRPSTPSASSVSTETPKARPFGKLHRIGEISRKQHKDLMKALTQEEGPHAGLGGADGALAKVGLTTPQIVNGFVFSAPPAFVHPNWDSYEAATHSSRGLFSPRGIGTLPDVLPPEEAECETHGNPDGYMWSSANHRASSHSNTVKRQKLYPSDPYVPYTQRTTLTRMSENTRKRLKQAFNPGFIPKPPAPTSFQRPMHGGGFTYNEPRPTSGEHDRPPSFNAEVLANNKGRPQTAATRIVVSPTQEKDARSDPPMATTYADRPPTAPARSTIRSTTVRPSSSGPLDHSNEQQEGNPIPTGSSGGGVEGPPNETAVKVGRPSTAKSHSTTSRPNSSGSRVAAAIPNSVPLVPHLVTPGAELCTASKAAGGQVVSALISARGEKEHSPDRGTMGRPATASHRAIGRKFSASGRRPVPVGIGQEDSSSKGIDGGLERNPVGVYRPSTAGASGFGRSASGLPPTHTSQSVDRTSPAEKFGYYTGRGPHIGGFIAAVPLR